MCVPVHVWQAPTAKVGSQGLSANVFYQLWALLGRVAKAEWRDTKYNVSRFIVYCLVFVFFGVLFRSLKRHDFAGVQVRCRVVCAVGLCKPFVTSVGGESIGRLCQTLPPCYL